MLPVLAMFPQVAEEAKVFTVRIEESFAAAHFLRHYHGKCENLHGHNYRVRLTVRGTVLDEGGMLVDFGVLKKQLREIIGTVDHTNLNDHPFFTDEDPSAERIALFLYREMHGRLPDLTFQRSKFSRRRRIVHLTSRSEPGVSVGESFVPGSGTQPSPYLTRQLLAYIGNKRRLLSFLGGVFGELDSRKRLRTFLDPFAGTGAVSRLARVLGYGVRANDWEFYSWVMNSCFLEINRSELQDLFGGRGGIDAVFRFLNTGGCETSTPYISRYYAPHDTVTGNYRSERLFYTNENASAIDRIRSAIELWYPGWELSERQRKEKLILLAALLYEASVHANTSGVFKAYHKGFGGHGKDALKRILAPIELEIPELMDATEPSSVYSLDAVEFCRRYSGDLCYLDPPYTIHQYGSNYFMLNTIARWDRPTVSLEHRSDGRLKEKAGIRKDWKETKSEFCYRKSAPTAFRKLFDMIDTRYIALSYNTEGIVPLEELLTILSSHGNVEIFTQDYTVYRGGKQSLTRKVNTLEFLLVITRSSERGNAGLGKVRRKLKEEKALSLMKRSFNPMRVRERFSVGIEDERISWHHNAGTLFFETENLYRINAVPSALTALPEDALDAFCSSLEYAACRDRKEECEVLIGILSSELTERERKILPEAAAGNTEEIRFQKVP